MGPSTIWGRVSRWFLHLPIRLAYRIVWAMASLGSRNARDVYQAMWDANLNLPLLANPVSLGGDDA